MEGQTGNQEKKLPGLSIIEDLISCQMKSVQASLNWVQMVFDFWTSLSKYQTDFLVFFSKASLFSSLVEKDKVFNTHPQTNLVDYFKLLEYNLEVANQAALSSIEASSEYFLTETQEAFSSWLSSIFQPEEPDISDYISRNAHCVRQVAQDYWQAIEKIGDEFGFHFEKGGYDQIAETDRFTLYQVLPTDKNVYVRTEGKPVLIVHPYVLGADILAFLPKEDKSYVHCFANQGIPTYVRILKDLDKHPAVQEMTLEDDILDTKDFCQTIKKRHEQLVTLNGYCQGGLITLSNILSGELDGLVDAHITCVSPIDGTRSSGIKSFLDKLPQRFLEMDYGTKLLANGNRVVDGDLMSWIYKLKSISDEYPIVSLFRDLTMFKYLNSNGRGLSKTAAAINYWLSYQRQDLPVEITKISFASYTHPISSDGTLPFRAFNRKLNLKKIEQDKIPWLICYGEKDTLVEKDCAIAPKDYIPVELCPFPKGHVAIATSWSLSTSECALHTCFGEKNCRGPIRFQLDLETLNRLQKSYLKLIPIKDSPESPGFGDIMLRV